MASLNQPSFAAGELSPELRRRIDLQRYSIGAEVIQNMIVLPRGGVQSRPGTQYLGVVKTASALTRLCEFIFSTTQAYILEFGNLYMRVWKDDGQVLTDAGAVYELATPWVTADLPLLKFEQSADTLFAVHRSYAPQKITRTAHNAWTVAAVAFVPAPLRKENDTETTISVTKTSAPTDLTLKKGDAVTLTASAATFVSTMVGGQFGIRHKAYATSYVLEMVGSGDYDVVLGKVWGEWKLTINPDSDQKIDQFDLLFWKSIDDGVSYQRFRTIARTTDSNNIEIAGSEEEPAIIKVTRDGSASSESDACSIVLDCYGHYEWSCFTVTAFTSATAVTGTALQDFDQCTVAFKTWAESSWSPYRGYPSCVGFYQDRLCFGQTSSEPNSFWDSKTGDYYNMGLSLPAVDDDSIQSRLPARAVNAIHWLVPLQAQIALTSDSEWSIEPTATGMFASSSLKMRQQSACGASSLVEPVVIDDLCFYITRQGNGIRFIAYDDIRGKQQSDVSIIASHLFEGKTIVDCSYQQFPHSIMWCVLSDGKLLSLTFHQEHEVLAWTRHETDGMFESVACIPGSGQDDVYFIVNRVIGEETVRCVEMLAHRSVSSASAFIGMDCSLTYSGAATTTITGLSHLEGKAVSVLADGVEVKGKTVASGALTLPKAASTVHVGLPYTWRLKTLQIDASSKQTGYSSDKKKLIPGATISVLNSYGGQAGDEQFVDLHWSSPKTSPILESDDIDVDLLAEWKKEGQFELTGSGIYPMHIISMMPRVQVGGK